MDNPLEHYPDHLCKAFIDHPSHAKPGIHPFPDRLHVITVVEDPLRWRSRYWNYWQFENMVAKSGAYLYTVEIAFGDRCFEVTQENNPRHLQLRSTHELLHKENAINLGVEKLFPKNWKKMAWIDADVNFTRPDWAQETLQLLEHYKVLQLFSHSVDLGPNYEPLNLNQGFVLHELDPSLNPADQHPGGYGYYGGMKKGKKFKLWHPGLAWAWTRDAYDAVGGLMDWVMGGSADYYMARALFNLIATEKEKVKDLNLFKFTKGYRDPCFEWQHRAERFIRRNVGVLPGTILHSWHGPKDKRQYISRAKMLQTLRFNPAHHLKRDSQGLYQLHDDGSTNFIQIRDGLRHLSRLRDEDSNQGQEVTIK
jgi:hypothetical protein